MRLSITRTQSEVTDRKGRSEGIVFQFHCQAAFDRDEDAVIERYGLLGYPAVMLSADIRGLDLSDAVLTPARLVSGWTFRTRFAGDAHEVESLIKEGCREFKDVMAMVRDYGGEDEVVFD